MRKTCLHAPFACWFTLLCVSASERPGHFAEAAAANTACSFIACTRATTLHAVQIA